MPKTLGPGLAEGAREVVGQVGEEPVPQQLQHLLEAHAAGESVELEAADDQAAGEAIHVGKHRFGGDDVFETVVHLSSSRCLRVEDRRCNIDVNLDVFDQCECGMWLTATEALARLGSKPQSLYASVSRGRIRAKPDPSDSRRSLYSAEDVERLAARSHGRRSAEAVAAEAMRWGDPILSSAISTIVGGRLYYRGQDAVALSRSATLEEVATLLWDGAWQAGSDTNPSRDGSGLEPAFAVLAERASCDAPSYGRTLAVLRQEAGSVLMTVAGALTGPAGRPLHERLAARWERPEAADILRRGLVLLADHELNASTFAARVAVSTGSPLAAGALAGLAALSGPLHGGASTAAFAILDAADGVGPEQAVRQWLGQGRPIAGFGHRLYPDGDSRAAELMRHMAMPAGHQALAEAVERLTGEPPNIDFALAALVAAYRLPREAALVSFTLARLVGWLAHMLEQAASGDLIRPRARYVGVPVPAG